MIHQSLFNWQQSPQQGTIPQPTDWQQESIVDDLSTALPFLQSAFDTAEKAGLRQSNYELLQQLGDALNACAEAIQAVSDASED